MRSTIAAPSAGEMKDFGRGRDTRIATVIARQLREIFAFRAADSAPSRSWPPKWDSEEEPRSNIRVVMRYNGTCQQHSTTWSLKGIECTARWSYPKYRALIWNIK